MWCVYSIMKWLHMHTQYINKVNVLAKYSFFYEKPKLYNYGVKCQLWCQYGSV